MISANPEDRDAAPSDEQQHPRAASDASVRRIVVEEDEPDVPVTGDGESSLDLTREPPLDGQGTDVFVSTRTPPFLHSRRDVPDYVPSTISAKHPQDLLLRPPSPPRFGLSSDYAPCDRASTTLPFIGGPAGLYGGVESAILVPLVTVTPEHKAIADTVSSVWAAVEVSTQVSRPGACSSRHGQPWSRYDNAGARPGQEGSSCFGHLYDINIEVLPTSNSSILEVIGNEPSLASLASGDSLLIITHIQLRVDNPSKNKRSGHLRCKSDELFEDLEFQLGSTSADYVRVVLSYRHSSFPQQDGAGEVSVQTRLHTTVTAHIKRQNSSSMWSPSPAPSTSPLLDIMASHWGLDAASNIMRRITTSKSLMPRKSAPALATATQDAFAGSAVSSGKMAQPLPRPPTLPVQQQNTEATPSPKHKPDPALKIWSEIRRISSSSSSSSRPSRQRVPSSTMFPYASAGLSPNAGAVLPGCMTARPRMSRHGDKDRQRPGVVQARRSAGAETLRSLQPANGSLDDKGGPDGDRDRRSDRSAGSRSGKGKRDSGKWAWTGWW